METIAPEGSILSKLNGRRVFDVERIDGGIRLTEGCDECFSCDLTREEVLRLADELRALVTRS